MGDLHEETSSEEERTTVQPELSTGEDTENADLHGNPDVGTESRFHQVRWKRGKKETQF
jgi:hypothetical protein